MSKLRRTAHRIKNNLLSDRISQTDDRTAEIAHSQSVLHHKIGQIQDKLAPTRSYGSYQMTEQPVVCQLFNGVKMVLDARDLAVAPFLILDGVWEDAITKAWLSVLRPSSVVLDIGANFGYYGILAAHELDKHASKVVLFEANPQLIPYIEKSLALNWLTQNTTAENLAVSDAEHKVTLQVLKDYVGSSSLHSIEKLDSYLHDVMKVQQATSVEVDAVTVDGYCQRNGITQAHVIKMDIEGYEEKAYSGMRRLVADSPDLVMFLEFTKDGYENAEGFYQQLLNDFEHLCLINESTGQLYVPKNATYQSVIADADSWVMLVLSKKELEVVHG